MRCLDRAQRPRHLLGREAFLAAQRQGTHDTLNRSLVTGSTRKIKKQKGTGTARAGSIKNPLFRGGGTVFVLNHAITRKN